MSALTTRCTDPKILLASHGASTHVANSLFTYLYWRVHADRLLKNHWLSTSGRTRNGTEKCLYSKFATEPAGQVSVGLAYGTRSA